MNRTKRRRKRSTTDGKKINNEKFGQNMVDDFQDNKKLVFLTHYDKCEGEMNIV